MIYTRRSGLIQIHNPALVILCEEIDVRENLKEAEQSVWIDLHTKSPA
jgi:hypothetical protein